MKYLPILCLFLALSACSQGFSTRHTILKAYGVYAIHPTLGLTGLGYLDYERKPRGTTEGKQEEKNETN